MKKIILIVLMLLFIPIRVQAYEEGKGNNVNDKQVEGLYEYITNMKTEYELLDDINIKDYVNSYIKTGKDPISFDKLLKALITYSMKEVAASMKFMAILIVLAIVCALLSNLESAFSNDSVTNIAFFACYAILIIIMAKSFYVGVEIARASIVKMSEFMMALMPVLLMLLASVGGVTEAVVVDPIIVGVITVSSKIFIGVIIPIICMSFVLQFVNNISSDYKINKLSKLFNQIALWAQGIIMTVFIGIITIRGISAKTMDVVAVKTSKYVIDNFVPIVGKSLSDAVSTVAGYSLLLKNALSSIGLIIILVIIAYPVIKILMMVLIYKLTAALIEPISDSRLVNCIGAAGDSLILIMSSLIGVSVMFFILISIIASAGKVAMGG